MNSAPSSRPRIVVVGSINMDLVFRTQRLARPGETVAGHSFRQIPGGKGANQAVAASRLGAQVAMVGRVGDDEFGSTLLAGLKQEGIDVTHVMRTTDIASGLAVIGVDDSGENSITVLPGANGQLSPADVVSAESVFQTADVLLLQLEIPLPTVHKAIETGRRYGLKIILDPAPAGDGLILDNLQVDVICPNETEAAILTGLPVEAPEQAMAAAWKLHESRVPLSLITMGGRGVVFCESGSCRHIPSFSVNAIDSTAAGDAFAAALGVALAERRSTLEAVRFASAAGALATTQMGAQPSMPIRAAVEELLSRYPSG